MPCFDLVMAYIKNVAIIIGIIVAVFTLVVHWKAIFRPDLKRIEERRFNAVEKVYSLISDYRFLSLYATMKGMSADELGSLLNEKMKDISSPFLPEHIKKSLSDFLYKLTMAFLLRRDSDYDYRAEEFKNEKEQIRKAHEKVFSETLNWFGCSGKSLPFPVNPVLEANKRVDLTGDK